MQGADCKSEQEREDKMERETCQSDRLSSLVGFEALRSEAAVLWFEKPPAWLSLNTVGEELSILSIP